MEKKCTKCGEVKSLDNFGRHKGHNDGKRSHCKLCIKNHNKEYYLQNKEQISLQVYKYRKENKGKVKEYKKKYKQENNRYLIKYQKEYRENNKEKLKEYNKKYYKKNDSKIKDNVKKYQLENRGKLKEYNKKHYQNNKEEINKKNKEYHEKNKEHLDDWNKNYRKDNKDKINTRRKLRIKNDPLFKLRCNISNLIYISLKSKGYSKKTKTYNMLKCEYVFFMEWLNGIAGNGNTYGIGDLHLDHVIPVSLAETEDESYLLNHYSNFQLLSADENQSKGNRYVNPVNLARVLEHHPNPDKIREIHARL